MARLKYILPFALIALIGCKAFKKDKIKSEVDGIQKSELVQGFENFSNSANTTIESVSIENNLMKLHVSYSGGCETHSFRLLGTESIQKSLPPKRGIMLFHDNKNDSCRELIETDLIFDISNLAYEGGEIILNLDGWKTPIPYTKSAN